MAPDILFTTFSLINCGSVKIDIINVKTRRKTFNPEIRILVNELFSDRATPQSEIMWIGFKSFKLYIPLVELVLKAKHDEVTDLKSLSQWFKFRRKPDSNRCYFNIWTSSSPRSSLHCREEFFEEIIKKKDGVLKFINHIESNYMI